MSCYHNYNMFEIQMAKGPISYRYTHSSIDDDDHADVISKDNSEKNVTRNEYAQNAPSEHVVMDEICREYNYWRTKWLIRAPFQCPIRRVIVGYWEVLKPWDWLFKGFAFKFDRRLSSDTAEASVKLKSDRSILNTPSWSERYHDAILTLSDCGHMWYWIL